jgi:hypothetical protein
MPFKSMSFSGFCKKVGISEAQGKGLIKVSDDQVDFCAKVSKKYGLELTLQDAANIYETSPLEE